METANRWRSEQCQTTNSGVMAYERGDGMTTGQPGGHGRQQAGVDDR